MLEIHSVAIQFSVVRRWGGLRVRLRERIRRSRTKCGARWRQLLNISEGCGSQGKNRNARHFNALGSAREVGTALEVAVAFGYVQRVDGALVRNLDRIRATLYCVLHR